MSRLINNIDSGFTQMPDEVTLDKRLSWKAKGIFLYLLMRPDGWKFRKSEIKNNASDGKSSLATGLKELTEHGYLDKKPIKKNDGTFDGYNWILTLPSYSKTGIPKNGRPENRAAGEPGRHNNTEFTHTEFTHTEKNITSESSENQDDSSNLLEVGSELFEPDAYISEVVKEADLSIKPTSSEQRATLLALHIWTDIDNLRPNNKITQQAKLGNWYDPVRLMVSEDGRSLEDIWKLWQRIKRDEFWRKNILSTGKLREKYDQLAIKLEPLTENKSLDAFIDSLYE